MSSLVFLGFSVVAFIIAFGVTYMMAAVVLGTFYTQMAAYDDLCCGWEEMKDTIVEQAQWLLPLMMVLGLFMLVLKVLMVASGRGRD